MHKKRKEYNERGNSYFSASIKQILPLGFMLPKHPCFHDLYQYPQEVVYDRIKAVLLKNKNQVVNNTRNRSHHCFYSVSGLARLPCLSNERGVKRYLTTTRPTDAE
ncbi:MAG: hypothetical protein RQ714_03145 [Nitrosomonas sp.]|nr:hypothetical protein [Nitrosomonas sp.]